MRSTVILLLASAACGPSEEMLQEMDHLKVRVADLEKSNGSLEREAKSYKSRVQELEQELTYYRNEEIRQRLGVTDGSTLTATFQTSLGDIHCELWPKIAPITVLNFVELAEGAKEWEEPRTGRKVRRSLYDGTIFHRVIPSFMIQGGDPLGTGTGGPGFRFKDEIVSSVTFDRKGLLAMANAGPDTNGSQFFITDSTPTHLNGKHTIFGSCADDMEVVRAIAAVPRDKNDKPLEDVVLHKVVISRHK